MRIVGICRYSLLGRGDWHAYRGKTDAEVEAVAKEQAKLLFAKDRMNARLESFEHLTLAVNGGVKTGHAAAQNQASGEAPSAMARALPK